MNRIFQNILIAALFIVLTVPTAGVKAQLSDFNDPLRLTFTPQFPEPNERIAAEVSGFGFDVSRATISWYVNGTLIERAIGQTTFSFETGGSGTPVRIQVTAQQSDGRVATASRTINPASIDLVWEGNTYTPPFYKGRALRSVDAEVIVTAYPTLTTPGGSIHNPGNLIYTWEVDGSILNNQSGYGKRRVVVESRNKRGVMTVTVTVSTVDETLHAAKSILIPAVDPVIRLYEHHPLLGVRFDHDLSGRTFTSGEREATIGAYPYFFSTHAPNDANLAYTWEVGSERIDGEDSAHTLTVRSIGEEENTRTISASIRHMTELLQTARSSVQAIFNAENRPQF